MLREEGSNGDRELAAAFHMAGFEAWDVNMHDLCTGRITLARFRGLAFAGGFSYADVLGSAKGLCGACKMFLKYRPFCLMFNRQRIFPVGGLFICFGSLLIFSCNRIFVKNN